MENEQNTQPLQLGCFDPSIVYKVQSTRSRILIFSNNTPQVLLSKGPKHCNSLQTYPISRCSSPRTLAIFSSIRLIIPSILFTALNPRLLYQIDTTLPIQNPKFFLLKINPYHFKYPPPPPPPLFFRARSHPTKPVAAMC